MKTAIVRSLPILAWLPKYNRAWLAGDLTAGLSVWALIVDGPYFFATAWGRWPRPRHGAQGATHAKTLYAVPGTFLP